jgi:Fungalysin metallopeptidase (M36)/PA domain/Ig-like domain CHU_C associated/Secretion system C-terminal sorting domain/Fungalysin/Thermolysin Propeptide Motif
MKKIFLSIISIVFFFATNAQQIDAVLAAQLVEKNVKEIGISKQNLENYVVSSSYKSENISYVYLTQTFKGLPVRNQMIVLSFKEGKLASKAGFFLDDLNALTNNASEVPTMKAMDAVKAAFASEKLPEPNITNNFAVINNSFDYGQPSNVTEKVTGELMWFPIEERGKIKSVNLVWTVVVAPKGTDDIWQVIIDSKNGNAINKYNYTVSEKFDKKSPSERGIGNLNIPTNNRNNSLNNLLPQNPSIVANADYLVVPYPAESPTHPGGTPAVRSNPWTAVTSGTAGSLGWHSNGTTDYTISRGNNVWATEDQAATNQNVGPAAVSSTASPNLTFNFPPVFTTDPRNAAFQQFSITNLFYWNNIIHDITYLYGFDEPGGNFQANNKGGGGNGGDDVIALSQSGAGGTIGNNANFSTPPDGGRPRMRMYLFNGVPSSIVHVNAPASGIANYEAVEGAFSTANLLINTGSVTGDVVYYNDENVPASTHFACNPPTNVLTGKIALINRGNGGICASPTGVPFTVKVKNAQNAGAIAVIMVNNVATPLTLVMGGTDNTITIPAVLVSQGDGGLLADNLPLTNVTIGPGIPFDGDLDNGIIIHEYMHGISNRITGGPNNTSCLQNAEQGGEGWSDYLGLMLTTNWATATLASGATPRPIGTYVLGQNTATGLGIRNFAYSTNIVTNPLTYANMGTGTIGTEVHNIGEIWCAAIWEMTWGIIQQEGTINPNLYNFNVATTTGGNSIALKLVMEGMKLQPCSPGFVDGRNAILAADRNLYSGRHACAIWTAFAKRGLGYAAVQGSSGSATDQTASTALPPAPVVNTQPVDVNTTAGSTVTFTANAGSDVNLIYQWQVSTNGGTTWTDIPNSITSTLTLTNVTTAMNANKYRAKVFIGCDVTNTNQALLTVTGGATPPVIATQPTATSVCAGANATFTASATGTGVTYSWEVSTNAGTTWTAVSPAVTTTTITLTAVPVTSNNYQYRLVATNSGGSVNSSPAVLTVNAAPAAPVVVNPAAYCQGTTAAILTATGTNLLWYTSATGGTGSPTAPTPSTTTGGTFTYYVSQTVSTCESPRAAIVVTVNTTPAAPTVITPINYCQNATATALTATGVNLKWYTVSTGGTSSATAPTPITTLVGSTTYYVSQTINSCEGPRAAIVVTITAVPSAPTVTTPITYCQGVISTPLTATGSTLLWYTAATGGTGSSTAPTPSTASIGATNYYVSQTTGCESPRALIVVNVIAGAPAPTAVSPVTYCQNATSVALTATGSSLLWYASATGGTGSSTAPTPATSTAGSTTYYVSQNNGTCESPRAAIVVTVTATPAAPTATSPLSYCQSSVAPALTATGSNLLWYTVPTAGTSSATAPTPSTSALGSITYYVSQTIATCEGPRTPIVVTITAVPLAPTVTTPVTYCQGSSSSPLTAIGSNLLWYTLPTGGTGSATAPTPSTATAGSTTFYVSQTTGCEGPRASIIVNITAAPASPTVITPVTYCQGNTTAALTATGANLLWYTSATGGTGSSTAPTPSATAAGTTNYYVSQTISGCESPRALIAVTVNPTPIAPTVISPLTYCVGSTSVALTATGTNLKWYTVATGGTGSTTAPIPSTASIGSIIYYVSQTTGICEGPRAAITVNVTAATAAPTVVSPLSYCQGSTALPLTATGTNLLWYAAATGGTGSSTAPLPSTTSIGSTTYYVSQTGTCESVRASIVVNVLATPTAPTATATVAYCQGSTPIALTATGTNLLWYTVAAGGTGSSTAPIPNTSTTGTITYYVSQSLGTCESARTPIVVNVSAAPAITTQPQDITSCTTSAIFNVAATGTSLTYQWYLSTDGGLTYTIVAGATSSTLSISGLTPAQANYKYRVIVSSGSCATATSNSVTARVGSNPVVVLTSTPVVNFNPSTNGGLYTTVSPVGNYTYQWKRNNNNITNITPSLTRSNGLLEDFGSYQVLVTDVATGCSGLSNIISVSDIEAERNRLFISPNPTQGLVKISYYSASNTPEARSIVVYDSKGAKVMNKDLTFTAGRYGSATLDLSRLEQGTYMVMLLDASGKKVVSDKIIKY